MAFGCHDTAMTLPQACAHVKRNGRGNGNDDFSVQYTIYIYTLYLPGLVWTGPYVFINATTTAASCESK